MAHLEIAHLLTSSRVKANTSVAAGTVMEMGQETMARSASFSQWLRTSILGHPVDGKTAIVLEESLDSLDEKVVDAQALQEPLQEIDSSSADDPSVTFLPLASSDVGADDLQASVSTPSLEPHAPIPTPGLEETGIVSTPDLSRETLPVDGDEQKEPTALIANNRKDQPETLDKEPHVEMTWAGFSLFMESRAALQDVNLSRKDSTLTPSVMGKADEDESMDITHHSTVNQPELAPVDPLAPRKGNKLVLSLITPLVKNMHGESNTPGLKSKQLSDDESLERPEQKSPLEPPVTSINRIAANTPASMQPAISSSIPVIPTTPAAVSISSAVPIMPDASAIPAAVSTTASATYSANPEPTVLATPTAAVISTAALPTIAAPVTPTTAINPTAISATSTTSVAPNIALAMPAASTLTVPTTPKAPTTLVTLHTSVALVKASTTSAMPRTPTTPPASVTPVAIPTTSVTPAATSIEPTPPALPMAPAAPITSSVSATSVTVPVTPATSAELTTPATSSVSATSVTVPATPATSVELTSPPMPVAPATPAPPAIPPMPVAPATPITSPVSATSVTVPAIPATSVEPTPSPMSVAPATPAPPAIPPTPVAPAAPITSSVSATSVTVPAIPATSVEPTSPATPTVSATSVTVPATPAISVEPTSPPTPVVPATPAPLAMPVVPATPTMPSGNPVPATAPVISSASPTPMTLAMSATPTASPALTVMPSAPAITSSANAASATSTTPSISPTMIAATTASSVSAAPTTTTVTIENDRINIVGPDRTAIVQQTWFPGELRLQRRTRFAEPFTVGASDNTEKQSTKDRIASLATIMFGDPIRTHRAATNPNGDPVFENVRWKTPSANYDLPAFETTAQTGQQSDDAIVSSAVLGHKEVSVNVANIQSVEPNIAAAGATSALAAANNASPAATTRTAEALFSTSPPTLPETLDLQQSNWGRALGHQLNWMVNNRLQEAEIRINPPHLGPLEVRMSLHQHQTNVTFFCHDAAVREAIESAIPRLREMLDSQGISLNQAQVSDQSLARQQAGSGEQQSHNPYDGQATVAHQPDPELPSDETESRPRPNLSGTVDDYA